MAQELIPRNYTVEEDNYKSKKRVTYRDELKIPTRTQYQIRRWYEVAKPHAMEIKRKHVSRAVSVIKDQEQEYIDIDLTRLEPNKFYLVNYKGELQAVRKISDYEIAFYDVVT